MTNGTSESSGAHTDHPETLPSPLHPVPTCPPTMQERLGNALRHIRALESHSAKLYQDNCHLVDTVNILNDRLTFLGAPQNLQLSRLSDLQEKLRASEENCFLINNKHHDLLRSLSTRSGFPELQAIREAYTSLDSEYRLLREKYSRLKALADTSHVAQQQPQLQTTPQGPVPVVRSGFEVVDQSTKSMKTAAVTMDNKTNIHRRSSDTVVVPSLRSAPSSVQTTWPTVLPNLPPTASPFVSQVSPTGFPVHAPVPAGSLPLPHHVQTPYDQGMSAPSPSVTRPRHLVEQKVSEQASAAEKYTDGTTGNKKHEQDPYNQNSTPSPLVSCPRPSKRPSSEMQTCASPGRDNKKSRTVEDGDDPLSTNDDVNAADKMLSSLASADLLSDPESSLSHSDDGRSYQDRVNLIFEKDAEIENGIFCGVCLDRHQANMIPEPPEVLIQPDFDFLVKHCMTVHPTVWEELRHKA